MRKPRDKEHIDISGHLRVPLKSARERAPKRPGWEPFFVNVDLEDRETPKVVVYRRST